MKKLILRKIGPAWRFRFYHSFKSSWLDAGANNCGSGDESGQGCQIINNTNFGEINNLLSQDRDMSYIAGHYQMCLKIGDGPQFPISQFFTKSKKVTDLFLGYDFRIDFLIT